MAHVNLGVDVKVRDQAGTAEFALRGIYAMHFYDVHLPTHDHRHPFIAHNEIPTMAASKKTLMALEKMILPVSALEKDQENCAVVVRVLRKWDVYPPRGGDKPVAVELVLVDKEVSVLIFITFYFICSNHKYHVLNLDYYLTLDPITRNRVRNYALILTEPPEFVPLYFL